MLWSEEDRRRLVIFASSHCCILTKKTPECGTFINWLVWKGTSLSYVSSLSSYTRDAMPAWALAMPLCLCLSVCLCLSQVGVLSKRLNESGWFWARELLSTYSTLCFKEIQIPSNVSVLPSGTVHQTLDLENLATAYQSSKRFINLARERWTLRAW